jgi:hypothetical protein
MVLLTVVAVFLLIGGAAFMDGIPDAGSDAGVGGSYSAVPAATAVSPAPSAAPAATPASVRSEEVVLDVTATVDGFELLLAGGTRADDVERIVIAVSDNDGRHEVGWQFPFVGERFSLPREMYGGSEYGTRDLRCDAVFENGDRYVVFAQHYY